MIKVGMLSFWHVHARDYAKEVDEHPGTEIAAVWDEIPERGRQQADSRGVRFYDRLEDLLSDPGIDGVIVDTPTNMHRDVMVAAAKAGKNIFTEKVLAPSLKECSEILTAVQQSRIKLTVSLPRLNEGYTLTALQILQSGEIGDITQVRVRLSHNGALPTESNPNGWLPEHFYNEEQCGGGALIDLGCHPMYLTRLFFGAMPDSLSASFGHVTGREVEDNAVVVLRYGNGGLGIVEAGFVNPHSPFSIEIHGTQGTLMYSARDNQLLVKSTAYAEHGWRSVPFLPSRPKALHQWVEHIINDTTAEENIVLAVDLSKLMEASNRSAKSGRSVSLSELN